MKFMNAIPVDRVNPRDDFKTIIEEGKKRIAAGYSVIIFPQSKRDPEFKPDEFNSIGVKLAKATKAPIIPMALKTDFSQNGKKIKDLGWLDTSKELHIEFGEQMELTGNGKAERLKIIEFIQDRLKAWNH
jgi:1-acyl-sn-glycerol-3-phosphate acyltransferase